jgi:hypothetical protein
MFLIDKYNQKTSIWNANQDNLNYCVHFGREIIFNILEIVLPWPQAASATIFLSVR